MRQAISFSIANQTKQWTSLQAGAMAPEEVRLDPSQIILIASKIKQQNSLFELIFELIGKKALNIVYEDFVKNPVKNTNLIGDYLGIPEIAYMANNIAYEKQSTSISEETLAKIEDQFSI